MSEMEERNEMSAEIHVERVMQGLFTEKLVTDPGRLALLKDPAFLRYGPKLGSNQFYIVVLSIVDYDVSGGKQKERAEDSDAYSTVVQETFARSMPAQFRCYPFVSDGDLYVLVNLEQGIDASDEKKVLQVNEEFVRCCKNGRDRVLRELGAYAQIYTSAFVNGYDDIDFRLEDLRRTMYTELGNIPAEYNSEHILTHTDVRKIMSDTCKLDVSKVYGLEQCFYTAVMRRDFDEAYRNVCDIIDIESRSFMAAVSLKHRLCNKIEALFSLLGVPYYCPEAQMYGVNNLMKWMEDAVTIDDMKAQMNMALNEFKRYFNPTVVTTSAKMNQIADYISQNYMDPNLCTDCLCEKFDISMSYLSRAFKAYKGVKLIDYIHITRLNAAKELLLTTDDIVEKIAIDVGYQSALTFTRAFKRYEQMTPGIFRTCGDKEHGE